MGGRNLMRGISAGAGAATTAAAHLHEQRAWQAGGWAPRRAGGAAATRAAPFPAACAERTSCLYTR